ncbi:hypothetical protein ACFPIK_05175 [Algoriphagus aquatilis]|uniref:O-antigen ligase domain-containing protein n=1 Tax=Algoriphagus aquatilis TaxID=490186 RepID=A0ABW0BUC3_9BACT
MESAINYSFPKITYKSFFWAAGLPGFLLIFRSILFILVQRRRSFDEVGSVDASATIQILYTVVCFGVSVYFLSKDSFGKFLLMKSPLFLLFLYHLLATLSVLWSVNPSMSGFRAFETIAYSLLILSVFSYLGKRFSIDEVIKWLSFFFVFSILFGAIATERMAGNGFISIQALLAEQFNSTPFFFFALLFPLGFWIRFGIVAISILSFSNTSYIGMALGALFLAKGNTFLKVIFFCLVGSLLVLIFIFDFEELLQNTIFYGQDGIGLEYTTGRDKIFDLAIKSMQDKPLSGYGFVAGETFIINDQFKAAIGAHNGLISGILGMGILGGVLYFLFFAKTFFYVYSRKIEKRFKAIFLSSITLVAIHSLGNPGIGSRVYGVWIPSIVILTFIIGLSYLLTFQKDRTT